MAIPNGPDVPRDGDDVEVTYIKVALAVKGALGSAGEDIFIKWAAQYPEADEEEDRRVLRTARPHELGAAFIYHHAKDKGDWVDPRTASVDELLATFRRKNPSCSPGNSRGLPQGLRRGSGARRRRPCAGATGTTAGCCSRPSRNGRDWRPLQES